MAAGPIAGSILERRHAPVMECIAAFAVLL
jgi:hypothetical protein